MLTHALLMTSSHSEGLPAKGAAAANVWKTTLAADALPAGVPGLNLVAKAYAHTDPTHGRMTRARFPNRDVREDNDATTTSSLPPAPLCCGDHLRRWQRALGRWLVVRLLDRSRDPAYQRPLLTRRSLSDVSSLTTTGTRNIDGPVCTYAKAASGTTQEHGLLNSQGAHWLKPKGWGQPGFNLSRTVWMDSPASDEACFKPHTGLPG